MLCEMISFIIFNQYLSINNGNRAEWNPIWSVIIRHGCPILLITRMITDRIGQDEVLLPINHKYNKLCDILGF